MTYVGISGFACMNRNFPSRRFLRQFPDALQRPFLPVLYNYFGKNWTTIKRFIKKFSDRPHLIEFHLSFRDIDPLYADYALEILSMMDYIKTPNTKVVICPVLEDVASDKEWRELAREVRFLTEYEIVRSSLQSNKGGNIQEKHGQFPKFTKPNYKTIANPDGVSTDVGDGESYFKQITILQSKNYLERHVNDGRKAVCLWSATQQGLAKVKGWSTKGLPDPKNRFTGLSPKDIVTDKAIEVFNELLSLY